MQTRESANEILKRMEADGHKVSALHGAYEGQNRDTLLDDFRTGRSKVLITTNVLARGIDVSSVSMVINYDIPMKGAGDREPDAETYLHRIGRTGRFGRVGVSISFVYDRKSFEALSNIAQIYDIDLIQLSPDDWDLTEKKVRHVIPFPCRPNPLRVHINLFLGARGDQVEPSQSGVRAKRNPRLAADAGGSVW